MNHREQRLAHLETATTQLVDLVTELRGERDRLRKQVQVSERELLQLRKDVAMLQKEREVVRDRLLAIDESLTGALATEPSARSTETRKNTARADESAVQELTLF